jgi:FkbM family methyltransferase
MRICRSIDSYSYLCYENDTISNSLSRYGIWEHDLIRRAQTYLHSDSVILDIGANIGTWSIPLAIHHRKVYAFEPYDSSFYALCGNIFMNQKSNIFPYHMALLDDPTKKTKLFLPEKINIGGCKLIETSETIPHRYTLATLDSLQFDRVDLIKLDVEGQELNVLKGGIQTITQFKPIIFFECWNINSPHWNHIPNTYHELMEFITSLGYTIHPLEDDNYEAIPLEQGKTVSCYN